MKRTALITGASSGIGEALAHELAANGYDIIAVADGEPKLEAAARGIREKHGVDVRTIAQDLTAEGGPRRVYDEVKAKGVEIDVLINDAGVGQRGRFVETPLEKDLRIVRLNVEALVVLTKLFLRDMVARGSGRIMNLGSVAGFEPGPLMSVYHGTKAFVVSFSEAIATELEGMDADVTVTCLCPGPTATDFFPRADLEDTRAAKITADPAKVAKAGYEALMRGERIHVAGASNKVLTFTRRLMSKHTQAKVNEKLYESSVDGA